MLTKEDYANLSVFLSRAPYNGLQEASVALVLFQKLQALAQPDQVKEVPPSGADDTKNGDK
jgi:hypothetical protein